MTLEEQLVTLESVGIRLNQGVTIDDLLYSFDREEYEAEPFATLMFVVGLEIERKPWGRFFSDAAWNLDMECIEGAGSYVAIVQNLSRVAGKSDRVTDLKDRVDYDSKEAWVAYKLDGVSRRFEAQVENDWADPDVVTAVLSDLEGDGKRFFAIDNGQASIWYYLDSQTARRLKSATGVVLSPSP